MTTLVFVLGGLILAVIGLGMGLWKLSRGSSSLPREGELAQAVHNYAPMIRLFDGRDLTFLKTQPGYRPKMSRRLRLERRRALMLYLTQVHEEFRRFWACCRELAAISNNSEMATQAAHQLVVFYSLYLVLKVHCWVSLVVYVPLDARKLVGIVQTLQQSVRQAVRQSTPAWTGLATGHP